MMGMKGKIIIVVIHKVNYTLEHAMKVQNENRGIAALFL
jgi:hypothetical protein